MAYESITINSLYPVLNFNSIKYYETMTQLNFHNEESDTWEFIYIDKGTVSFHTNTQTLTLSKSDIFFHRPSSHPEFHLIENEKSNLLVGTFRSKGNSLQGFENKVFKVTELTQNSLSPIISESNHATTESFGHHQLMNIYMEIFLIQLMRQDLAAASMDVPPAIKRRSDSDTFNKTIEYLEDHVCDRMTIEQICTANLISRSRLQKIFRDQVDCGVMEYFSNMKIEAAKQMLRDKNLNITKIAAHLGYSSVYYFSRQFKKTTGMTPSRYCQFIEKISTQEK